MQRKPQQPTILIYQIYKKRKTAWKTINLIISKKYYPE